MIDVRGMDELRAAALLFRQADAPTRAAIRRESQAWAPTLKRAAVARARGGVERRIARSGKTSVTAKGPKAVFGSSGRIGKDSLAEVTRPYEFGTHRPDAKQKYLSRQRTSKRAVQVTRRTQKQVPRAAPNGRFIYPAVADATPALAARWVRAVARVIADG